jgi:hypothetical protein
MAQYILAYLSADYSEAHVVSLRLLVESLGAATWSRGAPQFIDDVARTQPEDEPLRTVGLQVLVSEPGDQPPTPVDEPTRLLEALAKFSGVHLVDLEVQYGEEVIGAIFNGVLDRGIREGLLGAW